MGEKAEEKELQSLTLMTREKVALMKTEKEPPKGQEAGEKIK